MSQEFRGFYRCYTTYSRCSRAQTRARILMPCDRRILHWSGASLVQLFISTLRVDSAYACFSTCISRKRVFWMIISNWIGFHFNFWIIFFVILFIHFRIILIIWSFDITIIRNFIIANKILNYYIYKKYINRHWLYFLLVEIWKCIFKLVFFLIWIYNMRFLHSFIIILNI